MKNKIISIITLAIFLFSMIGSPSVSAVEMTTEFTFLINDGRMVWESNYNNMDDGDEDTYASTTHSQDVQRLSSGVDFEETYEITAVHLKVRAYWTSAERDIVLQPIFSGNKNGDLHPFNCQQGVPQSPSEGWSSWINITNDTNAHSYWTWDDVEELCCNVTVGDGSSGFNLYCSIVKCRVTYNRI